MNSQFIFYTKHFTIFAVQFNSDWLNNSEWEKTKKTIMACSEYREVDLVLDASYSCDENNVIETRIYVRDNHVQKKFNREGGNLLLISGERIKGLPRLLRNESELYCNMVLACQNNEKIDEKRKKSKKKKITRE